MDKIKSLNLYQKIIMMIMIIMALVFAVIYPMITSRVGFAYKDTILVPSVEGNNTVYSGKLMGAQARFTVTEDNVVVFQHGDRTYGPYTVKEDPAAIPQEEEMAGYMTGVELRNGDEILFRGGIIKSDDNYWMYNEDGTFATFDFVDVTINGIESDQNGDPIDPAEPSVPTILALLDEPEMTHKGDSLAWFGAVLLCVVNALTILYADELFRWNLSFQIRNAEHAEPSDWELTARYIGWTVFTIMALAIFILGLQ